MVQGQNPKDSAAERASLDKEIVALKNAFEKGDVKAITQLHSPNVVKFFGGNNVVVGRAGLEKQLTELLQNAKVEFIENKIENTVFSGDLAIQTAIFAIKSTPKKGGKPVIARGRSMVIYIKDKTSPTGWLSLREMTQEAPPK